MVNRQTTQSLTRFFLKAGLFPMLLLVSFSFAHAGWQIVLDPEGQRIYRATWSRKGNYPNRGACDKARLSAVPSSDRLWAMHTHCEGSDDPSGNVRQPGQSGDGQPGDEVPGNDNQEVIDEMNRRAAEEKQREAERQRKFEQEKQGLLNSFKPGGGIASGTPGLSSESSAPVLGLKPGGIPIQAPAPGAGSSGLVIKPATTAIPQPASNGGNAKAMQEAQKRIAELQRQVSGIQTLLRQYSRTLANNSSEFDKWGNTVDEAYRTALKNRDELQYSPEKIIQIIGETYSDLAAIGQSWFSINRLNKDTVKIGGEVQHLSYRMERLMKEIECLKGCKGPGAAQQMDKCRGKTRLSTPPPAPW